MNRHVSFASALFSWLGVFLIAMGIAAVPDSKLYGACVCPGCPWCIVQCAGSTCSNNCALAAGATNCTGGCLTQLSGCSGCTCGFTDNTQTACGCHL